MPICGYVHMPSETRRESWKSLESGVLDGLDMPDASPENQTGVILEEQCAVLNHSVIIPALVINIRENYSSVDCCFRY